MSEFGASRHLASDAAIQLLRSKTDIQPAALTEQDLWVRVLVQANRESEEWLLRNW